MMLSVRRRMIAVMVMLLSMQCWVAWVMMFSLSVVESWIMVLICSLSGVVLMCSFSWVLIAVSRLVYGFKVFTFLFLGCWYVFLLQFGGVGGVKLVVQFFVFYYCLQWLCVGWRYLAGFLIIIVVGIILMILTILTIVIILSIVVF